MKNTFVVTESEAGQRIDVLCAKKFPEISRSQWQKSGTFLCNGKECPDKTKVREGETWEVSHVGTRHALSLPEWDFSLRVLADSKSWVAIEKPAGISVHPSPSDPSSHTVVNALVHQFGLKHLSSIGGQTFARLPEEDSRPGIVHRLDKVTSGVLLIAKTNAAHEYFKNHWKEVEKTYFAVVTGTPPRKGRIEAGIFRDERNRKKMSVSLDEKAREAVTHFERVESSPLRGEGWGEGEKKAPSPQFLAPCGGGDGIQKLTRHGLSLLKIQIPTGRTHQIRVHLSSIGFPIVGDEMYGGEKAKRVFLHAASLTFPDPDKKGKKVTVESEVPKEF